MARPPSRARFVSWFCAILTKRHLLLFRRAFTVVLPLAGTSSTLPVRNMIASRTLLLVHASAPVDTKCLLPFSPRWIGHAAISGRLHRTSVPPAPSFLRSCSSSPPGDPAADPPATAASATSQQWKLHDHTKHPPVPVSLEDYVALGPRYRPQHSEQQEQHLALREPTTATVDPKPVARGERDSTRLDARRQQQHRGDGQEREGAGEWLTASLDLAESLGIHPSTSTEAHHRRIFHLYLPVYFWLKHLLSGRHRRRGSTSTALSSPPRGASAADRPLVVGINAPQGCGKTTLVSEMQRMLDKAGYRSVVVSIDDFYLTGAEQDALAARYPTNPLLQVRGNAGTHDLALALRTIRALAGRETGGSSAESRKDPSAPAPAAQPAAAEGNAQAEEGAGVCVPRYDKSARGGKGDRAPDDEWGVAAERPDIVLLEGWMLGFEALADGSSQLVSAGKQEDGTDNGLEVVNTFLKDYRELHDEVDAWLVLKTADPEVVFEWRAEAERRMREAGRPGMSEEQVRDFCSRYMPAYRAYLPGLYERCRGKTAVGEDGRGRRPGDGGDGDDHGDEDTKSASIGSGLDEEEPTLVITVGRDRNPVA